MVRMDDIAKSFGPVRALSGVTLHVAPGEVHAVMGVNGAGKSTLVKILAGAIRPDAGTLRIRGEVVSLASPADALSRGIAVIHQELSLVGTMSVLDNLLLGVEGAAFGGWMQRARDRARAARALEMFTGGGAPLSLDAKVEDLPLAARQVCEITRALARDADVLVMDEPTSALSEEEAKQLYARIGAMRAAGKAVIIVTHRLEEALGHADRVTVLRDGRRVMTKAVGEMTGEALVAQMTGEGEGESEGVGESEIVGGGESEREREGVGGGVVLAVRDLVVGRGDDEGVSFEVGEGEVVAFAGLAGAGIATLFRSLYGVGVRVRGEVVLAGRPYAPRDPEAALARGVAFVDEDRRTSGILAEMTVTRNITLSSLPRLSRLGFPQRARERAVAADLARALQVRASSLDAPVAALSGGNQQKVVLARAALTAPRLFMALDPTRGVDVRAKAEIHRVIRGWAARGVAVMVSSGEVDELLQIADRVVVMQKGRIAGEFPGDPDQRARIWRCLLAA